MIAILRYLLMIDSKKKVEWPQLVTMENIMEVIMDAIFMTTRC